MSTNLRSRGVVPFGVRGLRGRWERSPGRLAHRGDTEWEPAAEVVFRGQARSPSHRQIRGACRVRCDDGRLFGAISGGPGRREKPRREGRCRPYPKPTLVVR